MAPPSTCAELFVNVQSDMVILALADSTSRISSAPPWPFSLRRTGRELLGSFLFAELEMKEQLWMVISRSSSWEKNVSPPEVVILL